MSERLNRSSESDENPYAAPSADNLPRAQQLNGRAILAIVLLSILIVPATLVAGLTTCFGTFVVASGLGEVAIVFGSAVGLLAGLLVFASILRQILNLLRRQNSPD